MHPGSRSTNRFNIIIGDVITPQILVEVPVTDKNANLHQGLGVPSLPYGHIYHPEGGLVEELKIHRRQFPKFAKVVHSYAQTNCDLIDGDTKNPYPDPEKESAGAGAGANRSAKVPV